ncbi:uncharacterized protein B0H18DRAFT_1007588 [Fomitopsis serialis]|uniref:uncharacterized protein n=1 Tax=Fomitopsis serialis TaxID=139415 RepID=UPI002007F865|nr:uncharacterized protein B0H18DRAFT_1007588 [Neoantrodia serialis]KAH9926027.1 hypothetical protein B0H18DRAFT_1007588 [Neoantrodia serialis]
MSRKSLRSLLQLSMTAVVSYGHGDLDAYGLTVSTIRLCSPTGLPGGFANGACCLMSQYATRRPVEQIAMTVSYKHCGATPTTSRRWPQSCLSLPHLQGLVPQSAINASCSHEPRMRQLETLLSALEFMPGCLAEGRHRLRRSTS